MEPDCLWPVARANLDKLNPSAIFKNAPILTRQKCAFLENWQGIFHFNNIDCHCKPIGSSVLLLENYIAVLFLADYPEAEESMVTQFCETLHDVRRPVILSIVQAV